MLGYIKKDKYEYINNNEFSDSTIGDDQTNHTVETLDSIGNYI
jgi:hypothetical protein